MHSIMSIQFQFLGFSYLSQGKLCVVQLTQTWFSCLGLLSAGLSYRGVPQRMATCTRMFVMCENYGIHTSEF